MHFLLLLLTAHNTINVLRLHLHPQNYSSKLQATAWTQVATTKELKEAGGKKVVEVGGQRVLLAEVDGEVYAVSNKCSHLGLPLVGKTAMFQATVSDRCVTCPAHGTKFDLASGEVVGDWCPSMPNLPFVGKIGDKKPLPTFQSRVDASGAIEVLA